MTKKELNKILTSQNKQVTSQRERLLELICDNCHHAFTSRDDEILNEQHCKKCRIAGNLRSLVDMASAAGKIEAYGNVSVDAEVSAKEEME